MRRTLCCPLFPTRDVDLVFRGLRHDGGHRGEYIRVN